MSLIFEVRSVIDLGYFDFLVMWVSLKVEQENEFGFLRLFIYIKNASLICSLYQLVESFLLLLKCICLVRLRLTVYLLLGLEDDNSEAVPLCSLGDLSLHERTS